MIREPSRSVKAGAVVALKAAAAASCLALIAPALSGCGQEDEGFHPPVQHAGAAISESDYIAHVSALALAVEEGLYGEAAAARARELGGGEPTREEIERFADHMRNRPARWVEIEQEIERRVTSLRKSVEEAESERSAASVERPTDRTGPGAASGR